jgi:hypothetical protein
VMLVLSLVLGIIPLLGIVWTIISGSIMTVDGLFMSLILLTLSGILLLNALSEAHARGYLNFLHRKRAAEPAPAVKVGEASQAQKTNTAAPAQKTSETPQVQKTS